MTSGFVEWRERRLRQAERAAKQRKQRRKNAPKKPAEPEPSPRVRVARAKMNVRELPETSGSCSTSGPRTLPDLLPGTLVRVMERRRLEDGAECARVALHQVGSGEKLLPLGWVTNAPGGKDGVSCGGATLLALSPRREGVPPAPEALTWLDGLAADQERHSIEKAWAAALPSQQFRVLRMKRTEDAHTGQYIDHFLQGTYACAGCGRQLYSSCHKFESSCGWPSFCDNLPAALHRVPCGKPKAQEIVCAACGGHIGHVFKSPFHPPPRQERHCVNSIALKFVPCGAAQFTPATRAPEACSAPAPAAASHTTPTATGLGESNASYVAMAELLSA